jgi:hypothetical protein
MRMIELFYRVFILGVVKFARPFLIYLSSFLAFLIGKIAKNWTFEK